MVAAGRLGRKAGRGYYDYRDGPHRPDDPSAPEPDGHEEPVDGQDAQIQRIDRSGFTALSLLGGSLARFDPGGTAVGYVALPSLAEARAGGDRRPGPSDDAGRARGGGAPLHRASGNTSSAFSADAPGLVLGRILCQIVNEAHFAVQEGVATPRTSTRRCASASIGPAGPSNGPRRSGPTSVVACLDALYAELGEERYRVSPALRLAGAAA